MQNFKHSIVIVSFNQEQYIANAIKSIYDQELKPYELIILDDCSTDATVKVAYEFIELHKPSFKCQVIVNDHNLGIPKNMKKAVEVSSGNIFSLLAADDIFLPNFTRCVEHGILRAGLNPENEAFVSFSASMNMELDGSNQVVANYKIFRNSPFRTMIRKCAPFGKIGFSKLAMLNVDYPENIGLWADWAWDISICQKAKKYYVLDEICYVHYAKIGVSSSTSSVEIDASYLEVTLYLLHKYKNSLLLLDRIYLEGEKYYLFWKKKRGVILYVISIIFTFINIFNAGSLSSRKSLTSRFFSSKVIMTFQKIKRFLK